MIYWLEECDVWQGKQAGDRARWVGRLSRADAEKLVAAMNADSDEPGDK